MTKHCRIRKGVTTTEMVCVTVFVVLIVVASVGTVGSLAKEKLETTAEEISNPKGLLTEFFEFKGKRKGNNGVGNGEDPQPPGNPPINDGPGTSPGNPGNRGGFK